MELWVKNGATVAWMVDPYRKTVTIYASGRAAPESGLTVAGTGPVEGFVIEAAEVWHCYEPIPAP